MSIIEIRPQRPQEIALAANADVIILGGAKGGGKSWTLRLAPVRYLSVVGFQAVIFRRTLTQISNPGGQWDKSYELYPHFGGRDNKAAKKWTFPAKSAIAFSYLKNPNDWANWQGTEVAMFGFDQLEEFTEQQFLKILGCSRTTSGVPTQVWATCNPDADSWLRKFVDPWIASDGYVDPEQDGTIKYFTVIDDQMAWVSPDWRDANDRPPKSCIYVSADVWDNPALLEADPNYLSNLMAQGLVDRERFLGIRGRGGNWNTRPAAGKVFRYEWWKCTDRLPSNIVRWVRFWDFASSEKSTRGDDPDWTVGVKMALLDTGRVLVADVTRTQDTPAGVEALFAATARADGPGVALRWWEDPGQAGVAQSHTLRSHVPGFDAVGIQTRIDKYSRAKPFSRACEFGEVYLLEHAGWNVLFTNECSNFPDGDHDDQVDAAAGAYLELKQQPGMTFGTAEIR